MMSSRSWSAVGRGAGVGFESKGVGAVELRGVSEGAMAGEGVEGA